MQGGQAEGHQLEGAPAGEERDARQCGGRNETPPEKDEGLHGRTAKLQL